MNCGIILDNEYTIDVRVLRETGMLIEDGSQVSVLCLSYKKNRNEILNGVDISRIYIPRKLKYILFFMLNTIPLYDWLWIWKIQKFIKKNNFDVLHVHDLYMAKAANRGIRISRKKIPMILDLHENYPYSITTYNWTKGLFRRIISRPQAWHKKEKQYLLYADRIIVLSYDFRDYLINKYPEIKSEIYSVIPNVPDISIPATDTEAEIPELPFNNTFPVLIYYGVVAERRGVFDSLEVFTELNNNGFGINFLIIGPIDKKDKAHFFECLENKKFADRIHYIPWITFTYLPSYLKKCDICLAPFHKNPQHESGVANKIFEYMLGGKPIIASDCKPQKEVIEKNNCGIIYSNMEEFKNAILTLIENPDLREELGKNGYNAVKRDYNTEKLKVEFISIYKSINT